MQGGRGYYLKILLTPKFLKTHYRRTPICPTFEEDDSYMTSYNGKRKREGWEENLFKSDGRKGNRLPQKQDRLGFVTLSLIIQFTKLYGLLLSLDWLVQTRSVQTFQNHFKSIEEQFIILFDCFLSDHRIVFNKFRLLNLRCFLFQVHANSNGI